MRSIYNLQCDGVESEGDTQARVKTFLDDVVKDIKPETKNIIIFAHGALLQVFVQHLKSRNAEIPEEVSLRVFRLIGKFEKS